MDGVTGMLAAYALLSLFLLPERRPHAPWYEAVVLVADLAYFGVWIRVAPNSWMSAASLSYLLTSVVLLHEFVRASAIAALASILALIPSSPRLAWTAAAFGALAIAFAMYKRYLSRRLSAMLKQNVIMRSHAEAAREAERERIADDFHDGPLQHFISFQMRLEVIKKLLGRGNTEAATDEVRQLQDLCRNQVADLRSFARSMRPADDGADFGDSLSRMVNVFQRDTGIASTCSMNGTELRSATPDLLQIVREALHNIHKHSGASRAIVCAEQQDNGLQITIEDNGSGFPFSGKYALDELERLKLGPISIKRRVRLLNGELIIESHPDHGSKLEIRIPT
jgi:signal transduction histidine kinase